MLLLIAATLDRLSKDTAELHCPHIEPLVEQQFNCKVPLLADQGCCEQALRAWAASCSSTTS